MPGTQVNFPTSGGNGFFNPLAGSSNIIGDNLPFNIMATDYTDYIIIYTCLDFGFTGLAYADALWIMHREPVPSQASLDKVEAWFTAQRALGTLDYTFPKQMHKTT